MHMQMHHRLPGRRPRVDPNIVPIRLELLVEQRLHILDQAHQRPLLVGRRLEPGRHDAMRHDQGVPLGDWVGVEERKTQLVGDDPGVFRDVCEWGGLHGRECTGGRRKPEAGYPAGDSTLLRIWATSCVSSS
jgi:hypothetical protein